MRVPELSELQIDCLGPGRHPSEVTRSGSFVDESDRILLLAGTRHVEEWLASGRPLPSLERAGPREKLYFDPAETVCGILTCGGLCPGLNDVIRSLTLNLLGLYRVRRVLGFRFGYQGLSAKGPPPLQLTRDRVDRLVGTAGSFLGSSRGPQDVSEMVDNLKHHGVNLLFLIGGDGTLRGGSALAAEIARRGEKIAVVGVPKTIDNDLAWTQLTFGFHTAVDEARKVILAAYAEATSAENGVGLVKLMGRHSGFIAAHAARASGVAGFCVIPEEKIVLSDFLKLLETRLASHGHAVVVAAEGACQELMESDGARDASGNLKLQDVGLFLQRRISEHLKARGIPSTLKYLDPSYSIRSAPTNTLDSEYCLLLGHMASHAGMAGKTNMTVGWWHQHFVHLPIDVVTGSRKQVDLHDELWQSVKAMSLAPGSVDLEPAGA